MKPDPILSYSSPTPADAGVEARPSPVLELIYAFYFLTWQRSSERLRAVDWAAELRARDAELDDALARWGALARAADRREAERGGGEAGTAERAAPSSGPAPAGDGADGSEGEGAEAAKSGYALFLLACEFGYVDDSDPRRFLGDLPELPERMIEAIRARTRRDEGAAPDGAAARGADALLCDLERLAREGRAERLRDLLTRLWAALEPTWLERGRAAAQGAAEAFGRAFAASRDVLAALPPHHFTQFEAQARTIRASQEKGRIRVAPLYFATGGGFNFDVHAAHFIGYGVRAESVHEGVARRVEELVPGMKAFADPTRLMLLSLIARFSAFPLTVGDLALQVGVTQPTASGHLKVLREAGLVTFEKRGTKTFYQVDEAAVRGLTAKLLEAVAPD